MLRLSQFVICVLEFILHARLVKQAAALFLGGKNLQFQRFLFAADRLHLLQRLFVVVAGFFQHQHDHAHRDEQLQNGRHQEPRRNQVLVSLRERIRGQVHTPQQETEEEKADSNELPALPQSIKTQARKNTRNTDQRKNRKLDQQRITQKLRTDI